MQCGNIFERLRTVDLDRGNNLGPGTHHNLGFGAIGGGAFQKVVMFQSHPLGVTVHGCRKQQEPRIGKRETLLVNSTLA